MPSVSHQSSALPPSLAAMESISLTPEAEGTELYHSVPRPIRIAHVGAGAAGLITAYKARKLLLFCELVLYKKCVCCNNALSLLFCRNLI